MGSNKCCIPQFTVIYIGLRDNGNYSFLGDGSLVLEGRLKKDFTPNLLVVKDMPISFGSGAVEKQKKL